MSAIHINIQVEGSEALDIQIQSDDDKATYQIVEQLAQGFVVAILKSAQKHLPDAFPAPTPTEEVTA